MQIYSKIAWKEIRQKGKTRFTLKGFYFALYITVVMIVFEIVIFQDDLTQKSFFKYLFQLVFQTLIWCSLYRFYYWPKNEKRFLEG